MDQGRVVNTKHRIAAAVSAAVAIVLVTITAAFGATAWPSNWARLGATTQVTIDGVNYLRIPAGSSATTTHFQGVLAQSTIATICVDSWSNGQDGKLWLTSDVFDVPGNLVGFTYTSNLRKVRCKTILIASDYPNADFRVDMGVSGVEARRDTVRSVEITSDN